MGNLRKAQLILRNFKYDKTTLKNVEHFNSLGDTISFNKNKRDLLKFMMPIKFMHVSPFNHRNILKFYFSTK
jgi:hypothetical protein